MAFDAPPKNELAHQLLVASKQFVDAEIEQPDRHDYAIFAKAFMASANLTLDYYADYIKPHK